MKPTARSRDVYQPDNVTLLTAAARALAKEADKDGGQIKPGVHPVDARLTLTLKGAIEKGQDCGVLALPDVDLALLLAIVAKRAKWPRSEAKRLIGECLRLALVCGEEPPTAAGFEDRWKDAKDVVKEVRETNKVSKPRRGSTHWVGTVEIDKGN